MRAVLVVLVLLLASSGGFLACRHFAPAETKIQRRLQTMAEGFNDTRLAPCMAALAETYRDTSTGADREWIREGLMYSFFREQDPATRKFRWRVEIPPQHVRIAVDPERGVSATAEFVAHFHERTGVEEQLAWSVRITAKLEETSDGWRITETRHETVSGEKWWR